MKRSNMGLLGASFLLASLSPTAASAVQADLDPSPLVSTGSVTVETYEGDNETLLSQQTYGYRTERQLMSAEGVHSRQLTAKDAKLQLTANGSGGESSSSGCQRVTINNEVRTALGFTAYRYHTWTRWCWDRTPQVVSDVSTGWFISDIDPFFYWRGNINKELVFYDYSTNDGHPRSAYKHYRMGQFDNCVIKQGCISTTYPVNTLRSYYNGTFVWETDD